MAVKFLSNIYIDGDISTDGKVGDGQTYVICNATSNRIDFYVNNVHVGRLESDGDLHIKGDVIAKSTLF
jgi:hypothetical protein|tara:strand:+ start:19 stop:225 length:207 start_codon:yes stop_codon:yes gene_type:complete